MARRKHPKKEIERVLKVAERAGWTVESPPGRKFRMRCPCADRHYRTIALTPSGGYYADHVMDWLKRLPCWREER